MVIPSVGVVVGYWPAARVRRVRLCPGTEAASGLAASGPIMGVRTVRHPQSARFRRRCCRVAMVLQPESGGSVCWLWVAWANNGWATHEKRANYPGTPRAFPAEWHGLQALRLPRSEGDRLASASSRR